MGGVSAEYFVSKLGVWLHILQHNDTVDASEIPCPTTVWMVIKPYRSWDIYHTNW